PLDYSLRFGQVFARDARLVTIDVEAGATAGVTLAIAADPAPAAERLAAVAATRAWPAGGWRADVERARRAMPAEWERLRRQDGAAIHPLRVCAALAPHVEAGALLIADGGQSGQWVQAGLEPRERIINGLSGSIGSALPMAI